jgi:hypothetical protein
MKEIIRYGGYVYNAALIAGVIAGLAFLAIYWQAIRAENRAITAQIRAEDAANKAAPYYTIEDDARWGRHPEWQ